uniref:NADH-ubiquinone oxidoreductase chain 6 n=1 Tax=Stenus comma TaxID=513399 RepID=A0A0S2M903_9COLE|nr:NADH deshydrogenase subunit 6 [Stenus comma]
MFLTMMLILSSIILMVNHPLMVSIILLIQILIIALMKIILIKFSWFSYMIFLIMIGGLLIIFTYMTSIASNESFKFNKNQLLLMLMSLTSMSILINYFLIETTEKLNFYINFIKFFNYPINFFIIFLFFYLFITLIACVKICNFNQGPIRQKI